MLGDRVITLPTGHQFAVVLPELVDATELHEHKICPQGFNTYISPDLVCARAYFLLKNRVRHQIFGPMGQCYRSDGKTLWEE